MPGCPGLFQNVSDPCRHQCVMRIVIDCEPLKHRRAGVGTYVWQLLQHLVQLDFSNEYICFCNSFRRRFLSDLSELHLPQVKRVICRLPSRLLYRMWGSDLSRLLPVDRLTGAFDIFHYTNHLSSYQRGGQSVITVYDLSILRYPQSHPLRRRFALSASRIRWSLERATVVLTLSAFTKQEVTALLGINPNRIWVTPLGVGPEFLSASTEDGAGERLARYGIRQPFILCVATLEPRKNLSRLVQAYQRARQRLRLPHQLVIVGMRGWLWKEVFRTVHRLRLERDVVFTAVSYTHLTLPTKRIV